MGQQVRIQNVLAGEGVRTQVAFERTIQAVSLEVRQQETLLAESFTTIFTVEALFSVVHLQVYFIGIFHGECGRTERAQELVNLSMGVFVLC